MSYQGKKAAADWACRRKKIAEISAAPVRDFTARVVRLRTTLGVGNEVSFVRHSGDESDALLGIARKDGPACVWMMAGTSVGSHVDAADRANVVRLCEEGQGGALRGKEPADHSR